MLVSHRMVSRARRWRFGADWRDCRNGRRLLQTVTCERGRPSRGSLGRVAPVGNHRRSGQALALLLAGPWGSHRTFLGPSFSLRNRCGVTWGCGESFTDGEALRGYCSEGPDTGDLKIFLVWLPCDVQSRICFKISKGQLEQIVKKFLLISTAPRIWRETAFCLSNASLWLSIVSACRPPPHRERVRNTRLLPNFLHGLRTGRGHQRLTRAVSGVLCWRLFVVA